MAAKWSGLLGSVRGQSDGRVGWRDGKLGWEGFGGLQSAGPSERVECVSAGIVSGLGWAWWPGWREREGRQTGRG